MIKKREQKIINKKRPRHIKEFDKCIFCSAKETQNILNDSSGFYQLAVNNIKEINGIEYRCANYFCKTCESKWLGDWYL